MFTLKDMSEYRTPFNGSETAFMRQSLMYRMSCGCSYCLAACPAGEDIKPCDLDNKSRMRCRC